jgi:hypothetical protein
MIEKSNYHHNKKDDVEDSTNKKEYTPSEEQKQKLKDFQREKEVTKVDSRSTPDSSDVPESNKQILRVKQGQEKWRIEEVEASTFHRLTSQGHIGSTSCLILERCVELGMPDIVYVHNDDTEGVADNCEITAEWHASEKKRQGSIEMNQGREISMKCLKRLAFSYLEGDSDELPPDIKRLKNMLDARYFYPDVRPDEDATSITVTDGMRTVLSIKRGYESWWVVAGEVRGKSVNFTVENNHDLLKKLDKVLYKQNLRKTFIDGGVVQ